MPLPAIYTTAFDLAQPSGGKVTVLAVNKIMGVSGLPPAAVDKVRTLGGAFFFSKMLFIIWDDLKDNR